MTRPEGPDADLLARARALLPLLESASDTMEASRRLPPAVVEALHDAALFRLLLPRFLAGGEVDPVTFVHVIEAIAMADAQHRVVPLPGRRLLHGGRLSHPRGRAGDLRPPRRRARLGARARRARGGGGRRLSRDRHVVLRERLPSRHLARRPRPIVEADGAARRRAGRHRRGPHHAVPGRAARSWTSGT